MSVTHHYGLAVGPPSTSPTTIKGIYKGTVSVNPASISTVATGKISVTITGVRAGDIIHMERPDTLNDDLIFAGARVTADDTVTLYIYNPTGGGIDDGALTWNYLWFDLT
jgi:hypothetical protein